MFQDLIRRLRKGGSTQPSPNVSEKRKFGSVGVKTAMAALGLAAMVQVGVYSDLIPTAFAQHNQTIPDAGAITRQVTQTNKTRKPGIIEDREQLPSVIVMPDRILPPPSMPVQINMTDYDIDVDLQDNVATTTVEQTIVNDSKQSVEVKYYYPIPEGANFSTMSLTLNGQAVEGTLMEKDEAKQKYLETVRNYVDPGLLEYVDYRTVRLSIAPVMPGETKTIQLSYSEILPTDGGVTTYQYPFMGQHHVRNLRRPQPVPMTRQFAPGKPHLSEPKAKATPITLALTLNTQAPLKTIFSPTHNPKIERPSDKKATVNLDIKEAKTSQNPKFTLYFTQDTSDISIHTLAYQPKANEDGYFLLTLRPPLKADPNIRIDKDLVLVLDTSGSMAGEKIKQAKSALSFIIDQMEDSDRFTVVTFDTDVKTLSTQLMEATPAQKEKAREFFADVKANGGTNIEAAITTATQVTQGLDASANRPQYIIFLTDGEPTVGNTSTDALVKLVEERHDKARLFNFGVGYNVNTRLLGKMAETSHGSTTYVEPKDDLELALSSFYEKIESPVLTDVALAFKGVQVNRLYPTDIGDLFAGSELILLGRFDAPGSGSVTLSGKEQGKVKTFTYPLSWKPKNPTDGTLMRHSHLPRLWSGRRVANLLDEIRKNGEQDELKDEIIALSKQYGILTPYTSFLAMEPGEREEAGVWDDRSAVPTGAAMSSPTRYRSKGMVGNRPPAKMATPSTQLNQTSGRGAVKMQKAIQQLQAQNSYAAMDAEETRQDLAGVGSSALVMKTVGAKTFVLRDGTWMDTLYDKAKDGEPKTITFGTPEYFDLLRNRPELAPYLALGQSVLIRLDDGTVIQVVEAKTS